MKQIDPLAIAAMRDRRVDMKPTFLALAVISALAALPAGAQDYPERNMTLVVPLAAGGSADIVGRLLAQSMSEILGRAMIVENVAGAGGMLGAARVAKAIPDGYQILLGTVRTQAQNQTLYKAPLYDSTATAGRARGRCADHPAGQERLSGRQRARRDRPHQSQCRQTASAHPAQGVNHLACVLFNAAIGLRSRVPYRQSAELFRT